MPQFRPFRGLLYNEPGSAPDDGVMDITSALGEASGSGFAAKYLVAEPGLAKEWLGSGHLSRDTEPALYMYRAGWRDSGGTQMQASGVFGLVGIAQNLLIEPRVVNVENSEFELLLMPGGMPLLTAGADGTHFRVWPLRQAGVIATIADAVAPLLSDGDRGLVVATNDALIPPPGLVFVEPQAINLEQSSPNLVPWVGSAAADPPNS